MAHIRDGRVLFFPPAEQDDRRRRRCSAIVFNPEKARAAMVSYMRRQRAPPPPRTRRAHAHLTRRVVRISRCRCSWCACARASREASERTEPLYYRPKDPPQASAPCRTRCTSFSIRASTSPIYCRFVRPPSTSASSSSSRQRCRSGRPAAGSSAAVHRAAVCRRRRLAAAIWWRAAVPHAERAKCPV